MSLSLTISTLDILCNIYSLRSEDSKRHLFFNLSRLYAVGGRDGSSCLKNVERYDPHTNKWTSCASMIKRRGAVGVGVLNGYLYAVGGHDAPASIPSASRFDCVER